MTKCILIFIKPKQDIYFRSQIMPKDLGIMWQIQGSLVPPRHAYPHVAPRGICA